MPITITISGDTASETLKELAVFSYPLARFAHGAPSVPEPFDVDNETAPAPEGSAATSATSATVASPSEGKKRGRPRKVESAPGPTEKPVASGYHADLARANEAADLYGGAAETSTGSLSGYRIYNLDGTLADVLSNPEAYLSAVGEMLAGMTSAADIQAWAMVNPAGDLPEAYLAAKADLVASSRAAFEAEEAEEAEAPSQEPSAPVEPVELDAEAVRTEFVEFNVKYGRDLSAALLEKFGARRFSEVPADRYAEFLEKVRNHG